MIRQVLFKSEAELDLAEASSWYEKRDRGLGAELLRNIDSCVHEIQRHPEMYPALYRNIRQGVVRRFPYSIFCVVEEQSVHVIAVFHAAGILRVGRTESDESALIPNAAVFPAASSAQRSQ